MRIPAPRVLFEVVPLVEDSAEPMSLLRRPYVARLSRLAPNPQLLWETTTEESSPTAAKRAMHADIAAKASELGFDIRTNASGIKGVLRWSDDQALSLALEFVFPVTLAGADLLAYVEPKSGPGRPPILDAQTFAIGRLMAAWQRGVGRAPGFGPTSAFPRVVDAIAPTFGLSVRRSGVAFAEMRLALKAEQKKLGSGRIRYTKTPNVLAN